MKKICIKCGEEKELYLFYKHSQMKDGHLNKCIECCKAESKINGQSERAKRYNRNRPNKSERNEKNKKRMRELKINNPEKYYELKDKARKNYRKKNPDKYKAVNILNENIRKGILVIPDNCFFCNRKIEQLEAHHPDYSKPLEVVWLCSECHHKLHRNMRILKRKSI